MNPAWADPILSCGDAKALEARLLGGDEEREWAAMRRAGAAVARAVLEDFQEIGGFPPAGRVLVLAGKGHNGGDALLAAQAILEQHPAAHATVLLVFGERAFRPLAWRAWRDLVQAAPGRVTKAAPRQSGADDGTGYDLCVDGIFGFQFHPPIDAATAAVLRRVNAHPGIRLRAAVDLPSGLGEKAGDPTFRADFTYATGIVKLPALAAAQAASVGRLRYLDLGFFDPVGVGSPLAGDLSAPSRASALPTSITDLVLKASVLAPLAGLRAPQSDKRTFGHLFVLGGSRNLPGSVLMAVRAALHSGAGLVTAFVPESFAPAFAACAPEAIWVGWPETPGGGLSPQGLHLLRERLERATAMVVGPGLGQEAETLALAADIVKASPVPLVLDADALQPPVLAAAQGKRLVCLPHAGEFERIAGGRAASLVTVRAVAQETGATVVLKGPVTRIAAIDTPRPAGTPLERGPDSRRPDPANPLLRGVARSDGVCVYHSFFGGPVLARGGSGDLLAGLIGGLLAQAPDDPLLAACRGVVWHGLAADLLARGRGQVAVQVTQLLDYLPAALRVACDAR
jgi:NAD(P)H-hydrate epimerase